MELQTLEAQPSQLMIWLMVEGLQIVIILIAMWVSFILVKRGLTYLQKFIEPPSRDRRRATRRSRIWSRHVGASRNVGCRSIF